MIVNMYGKNRLVKDSFLILITNCITYIATMVNTRIISGSFSLTDYGYRAQVISIVTIMVSVFSLGFANAPNFFIPLSNEKEKNAAEKTGERAQYGRKRAAGRI